MLLYEQIVITAIGDKIEINNLAKDILTQDKFILGNEDFIEFELSELKVKKNEIKVEISDMGHISDFDKFAKQYPALKFEFYCEHTIDFTIDIREYEGGELKSCCFCFWINKGIPDRGILNLLIQEDLLNGAVTVVEVDTSEYRQETWLPVETSATIDDGKDKSENFNSTETKSLPATASEDIDDVDLLAELDKL